MSLELLLLLHQNFSGPKRVVWKASHKVAFSMSQFKGNTF